MTNYFATLKKKTDDPLTREICAGLEWMAADIKQIFDRLHEIEEIVLK